MDSKVDLSTSDSSQGSTKREVPSPTGRQERRPLSRQPRPKCPAIYDEMEKNQLFKKADPNQRDGEGASQRKGSNDKHKKSLWNSSQEAVSGKEHPLPLGKARPRPEAGSLQRKEVPEEEKKSVQLFRRQEKWTQTKLGRTTRLEMCRRHARL